MRKSRMMAMALASAAAIALATSANASVSYSTTGSTYTQNFDTLPNSPTNTNIQTASGSPYTVGWQDDTTGTTTTISIPGWYLYHPLTSPEGGFSGNQRMRFGSGSSSTAAFYSFGTNSSTERALGILPSASLAGTGDSMRIGLRVTNNTSAALTAFTITYDGEQYRDDAASDSLSFSYALASDISAISGATWYNAGTAAHFVNAATFNPPVTTGAGAAVLGNSTGLTANITATVTLDTPWQPGTDLWLRWSEINVDTSGDDGLAIDNVRFSADVPEPAAIGLLVIASLGLFRRRRA